MMISAEVIIIVVLVLMVVCMDSLLTTVVVCVVATATSKVDVAIFPSTVIVIRVCPSLIITTAWESVLPLAVVSTVYFYVYPTIMHAIASRRQEEENAPTKDNQLEDNNNDLERLKELISKEAPEQEVPEAVSLEEQFSILVTSRETTSKETTLETTSASKETKLASMKPTGMQFHDFIQTLVSLFENQRMKNYQFAVLVLSAHPDINEENTKFQTKWGEVSTPEEATNYTHPVFPPEYMMCNYVTARPEGYHAEHFLLAKFEVLLNQYSLHNMPCQHILLYSWMLPCAVCAWNMILALRSYTRMCRVTLVYTIVQKSMNASQAEVIIRYLRWHGICVQQQNYTKWLQPADRYVVQ